MLQKQFSLWQKIFKINLPDVYILIGGGRYFKLKHPKNEKYYLYLKQLKDIYIL